MAKARSSLAPGAPSTCVYAGTYTGGGSRGIYRFALDRESGALTDLLLAAETENPSFLTFHPNGRVLYAVNEVARGAVSAFRVDATGNLTLLNQQPSAGADPCHLVVDRQGRNLLVANYTGGSVAVLPLDADGRLRPASAVRQHAGRGPVPVRQEGPHAHAIALDAAEQFALAVDLGADRIFVYRYGAAAGTLDPNEPASAPLEPGSGPRHVAWHRAGNYLYAINELRSTLTSFRYDAVRGTLETLQTVTTLPAGGSRDTIAAEIAISPDGRFLYGSNRGHDSIAIFAIDATFGTLAPLGHVHAGGRTPRHFAIDASGRWLLVANQESEAISVFHVDETGFPGVVGPGIAVSKPVCVLFAPPRTAG